MTHSEGGSLKNRRVGAVGFCFESCPMLEGCQKKVGFSQVMEVYSLFVGFVTQLYSPSNLCMCVCVCVWSVDTLCVYTKLTFHLYHVQHTCSVFTALWCAWLFCCETNLLSPLDPFLALASN